MGSNEIQTYYRRRVSANSIPVTATSKTMPFRRNSKKALVLFGIGLFIISPTSAKYIENFLTSSDLNPFYPSAALTFDKSQFWIRYNDTSFGKTATLANLFLVGSALAIFSLLPENAFCSLKGTCYGGKPHFQQRYENYVDKYATNAHLAAQYRTDEDDSDYLNYPVEYIDRMGLANKRKRRPAKRLTHHRRRPQKREA